MKLEVDIDYYTSSHDDEASIPSPAPAYYARAYGSLEDLRISPTPSTLPHLSYVSHVLDISPTREGCQDVHQMV